MNVVQTVPELHVASLNGINGLGYAEVISRRETAFECRGVIIFDEDADLAQVEQEWRDGKALFTGMVYHEDREEEVTIPVQIKFITNEGQHEAGATFVANAARLEGL
jgi:hypothetical protein